MACEQEIDSKLLDLGKDTLDLMDMIDKEAAKVPLEAVESDFDEAPIEAIESDCDDYASQS